MIHVNPYYLFSHVVFIDFEKKFIFIEKRVWDVIHGLIFKNKLSTPTQRRRLRSLFFDAYYNYMYKHEPVDVQAFNRSIFFIYGHYHFSEKNNQMSVIEDGDGDVVLHDDRPYFQEVENGEKFQVVDDLKNKIIKYREVNVNQNIDDRINVSINYYICNSSDFNDLVNIYGFNRLRILIRRFIFDFHCRLFDEMDLYFIKLFAIEYARLRNQVHNSEYFYLCQRCLFVNTHKKDFRRNTVSYGQINQPNPTCYSHDVKWYNSEGELKLDYGTEDTNLKNSVFIKDNDLTGFAGVKSFRLGDRQLNIKDNIVKEDIMTLLQQRLFVEEYSRNHENFLSSSFFNISNNICQQFQSMKKEIENFHLGKNLISYNQELDIMYRFWKDNNQSTKTSFGSGNSSFLNF